MNPPVLQLPLDLTGEAPTNFVGDEPVRIAAAGNRAFVPSRGAFYTRNMVLVDATSGRELVPDVDYKPVHMVPKPSLQSGQEVCSVIFIPDTYRGGLDLKFSYHAVGDVYSLSATVIQQLLDGLDLDNRKVNWGDLIDVPEYFPPAAHLHDIGDVFGFEYLVAAVEQVRRAILLGDQAAFDEMRQYVDLQDAVLRALINQLQANFQEHINDKNNPHAVTKAQVGLGLVENYRIATQAEAEDGNANNLYMTPLRGRQQIQVLVGNTLTAHINNTNNPHGVTKAQVGLGSVVNNPMATTTQAQQGTGDGYMSAVLTAAAITTQAINPLNAHIGNTNNPHNTTKAQVGLGNVDNFKTATVPEATAGTANNLFLTPQGGRSLIDAVAGNALQAHIANISNPHQVTKAQVGLGNVDNYPTATQAQAQGASDNATFMTPLRTAQQITNGIGAALTNHMNNANNPHATTKAQVGLGSVENYPIATQGEAEGGNANDRYLTPLRGRQLVQVIAINPLQNQINNRIVINSDARVNSLTMGGGAHYFYDSGNGMALRTGPSNAYRWFSFANNGDFVASNGRIYGGAGFQPSDRRLKKNIKSAQARALWRLLKWKQWNLKRNDEHQRGVIAQELNEVAADYVSEFTEPGKKTKRLAVNTAGVAMESAFAAGEAADQALEEVALLRTVVQSQELRIAALESQLAQVLARLGK